MLRVLQTPLHRPPTRISPDCAGAAHPRWQRAAFHLPRRESPAPRLLCDIVPARALGACICVYLSPEVQSSSQLTCLRRWLQRKPPFPFAREAKDPQRSQGESGERRRPLCLCGREEAVDQTNRSARIVM